MIIASLLIACSLCSSLIASTEIQASTHRKFKLKLPKLILPKQTVEEMLHKKLDAQTKLLAQSAKSAAELSAQLIQERKELTELELHQQTLDSIRLKNLDSAHKKYDALAQSKVPAILHHYIICNLSPLHEMKRLRQSIQLHEKLLKIAKQNNETLPAIIKTLKKDLAEEHMA